MKRKNWFIVFFIAALTCFLCLQGCERAAIPPFTVFIHNAYDFDITLIGSANGCDYYKNRKTNPLCTLHPGEQRAYDTYGPGRSLIINTYKAGTEESVGSLSYTGKSGRQYRWVVGDNNPVIEMRETRSLYFAPTMQQELPTDQNSVYAASFPLAWQACTPRSQGVK